VRATVDGVAYRYLTVAEDGLEPALRAAIAALLAATLDDGEAYRGRAWRTLRPAFRVIALARDEPVGQASAFWVPCRPPTRLLGLGDVAVAPEHRRRKVARTVCGLAVQQPPLLKVGPTYMPGRGACFACHEHQLRRDFPLYAELAEQRRRDPPAATTLGPASGIVGTLLALELLHLLSRDAPPATHDRALLIDMGTLQTRWEGIQRDPGCPVCNGLQARRA
jgi:bacteriocin biosynthesis cyclodehydratase domain-containing protein